jgi:hypothetical protein
MEAKAGGEGPARQVAAEAQRRREEQERIAERDRKLQQQTEYLKMRLEETGKLHTDDPEH